MRGRRAAAVAILLSCAGLIGALWSLGEPQYQDALGYYVPYGRQLYADPLNLVFRGAPGIGHPPLHALLMAGAWWLGAPRLWAPHLLSLLPAIAVLAGLFAFATTVASARAGVAAVATMLTVPVFQSQARVATPEMLVAALLGASVLALARRRPVWAGVGLAGAVLTKETAVAVVPLLALWAAWDHNGARSRSARDVIRPALVVAGPPLVVLAAWATFHLAAAGAFLRGSANPAGTALTLRWLLTRTSGRIQEIAFVNGLLVLVVVGGALVVWPRRSRLNTRQMRLDVLGVAPIAAYLAVHLAFGFPLSRYMLPALPPLIGVLAGAVDRFHRGALVAVTVATMVLGLTAMWRVLPHNIDPEANLAYRHLVARDQAIAAYIASAARQPPGLDYVAVEGLPDRGFPYPAEFAHPFLGYVVRPFPIADTPQVGACRYAVVGAAASSPRPGGRGTLRLFKPKGPWAIDRARVVEIHRHRTAGC